MIEEENLILSEDQTMTTTESAATTVPAEKVAVMGRRRIDSDGGIDYTLFDDSDYALVSCEERHNNLFYSLYVHISQKLLTVTFEDNHWSLEHDAEGYNHAVFPNWSKYDAELNHYLNGIEEVEDYELCPSRNFSIYGYNIWQTDPDKRIAPEDYVTHPFVNTYLTVMVGENPMHCIAMSFIKHVMTHERYKDMEKPSLELLTVNGMLYSEYKETVHEGVDMCTLDGPMIEVPSDSKAMVAWALVNQCDMRKYSRDAEGKWNCPLGDDVCRLLDWLVANAFNTPLAKISQTGSTVTISHHYICKMVGRQVIPDAHLDYLKTHFIYCEANRTNTIDRRCYNNMMGVYDLLFNGIESISKKLS